MSSSESTNTAGKLPKRLYDESEAATYLGRSLWSMRELRYAGKIPFVRDGRFPYYDIHDLDAWIEKNKTRNIY